jgi:hypothetical protein
VEAYKKQSTQSIEKESKIKDNLLEVEVKNINERKNSAFNIKYIRMNS